MKLRATIEPSFGAEWYMGYFHLPAWMDDAACNDVEDADAIFFPERGGSSKAAKAICATCPVTAECLDLGLELRENFGIFGGMSGKERRQVAKERKRRAA